MTEDIKCHALKHTRITLIPTKIPPQKQSREETRAGPGPGRAFPTCATWASHAHGPLWVQFPFGSTEGVGLREGLNT